MRIEYSRDLLRSLARAEDQPDSAGLLYGSRASDGVRVLSTKPQRGLRAIGSFSARARGEVFMTESDIARLHGLDPRAFGLVIAGSNAGFFVREPDGSMQTIKSHQEFQIRSPVRTNAKWPAMPWLPLAAASIVAIAILVWPSRSLTIESRDGAVRIALHKRPAGAHLEITDGPERHSIPISPSLTSVVYSPVTRDVHVRLIR